MRMYDSGLMVGKIGFLETVYEVKVKTGLAHGFVILVWGCIV